MPALGLTLSRSAGAREESESQRWAQSNGRTARTTSTYDGYSYGHVAVIFFYSPPLGSIRIVRRREVKTAPCRTVHSTLAEHNVTKGTKRTVTFLSLKRRLAVSQSQS